MFNVFVSHMARNSSGADEEWFRMHLLNTLYVKIVKIVSEFAVRTELRTISTLTTAGGNHVIKVAS